MNSYAFACKPTQEAYDLAAYLNVEKSNVQIFQARVLKVRTLDRSDGLREQEVTLDVHKQWLGAPIDRINVRAMSGIYVGTSCEGVFDVVMVENEEWFVIIEQMNSTFRVKPMLSQRLIHDLMLDSKLRIIEEHVRTRSLTEVLSKN